MSAMDKLHSSMSHCQLVEVTSRLSKIPNIKKRLTEIIKLIVEIHKLTNEAIKMLDDLRADLRADYEDDEAEGE